jgi:hypothetical protein
MYNILSIGRASVFVMPCVCNLQVLWMSLNGILEVLRKTIERKLVVKLLGST